MHWFLETRESLYPVLWLRDVIRRRARDEGGKMDLFLYKPILPGPLGAVARIWRRTMRATTLPAYRSRQRRCVATSSAHISSAAVLTEPPSPSPKSLCRSYRRPVVLVSHCPSSLIISEFVAFFDPPPPCPCECASLVGLHAFLYLVCAWIAR